MRVGSLFSGIGGLDLALEMEGHEIVWQSEIDPLCCRVLAARWPGIPNLGDIRKILDAPPVDILCGGFPCQDVSTAGARRAGADLDPETRSGLWWEFRRLIGLLKPAGALIENVGGLTSMGLEAVRESLGALGYSVDVTRLAAEDVGAPHQRIRVFIVAVRGGRPLAPVDSLGGLWWSGGAIPRWSHERAEALQWPTPLKADAKQGWTRPPRADRLSLPEAVRNWPTPIRRDSDRQRAGANAQGGMCLSEAVGQYCERGPLNPDWVEPLMGFPIGWTRPEVSASWTPEPRWPMGQGAEQHDWEPPRMAPGGGHTARLGALGNAVVPWCARIAAKRLGDGLAGGRLPPQLSLWS